MTVIDLKTAARERAKTKPVGRLPVASEPVSAVIANVSLDLFLRASACIDMDGPMEFMAGVLIEPCAAGGVLMVSTDGKRIIVIRDAGGAISARTLVRLAPAERQEADFVVGEAADSRLVIGGSVLSFRYPGDDEEFGGPRMELRGWRMDDPFPHWRKLIGDGTLADGPPPPCNPRLFKKIGRALHSDPERQNSGAVRMQALAVAGANVPPDARTILVTAGGGSTIDGFGLVMPVAATEGGYAPPALPGWALRTEG